MGQATETIMGRWRKKTLGPQGRICVVIFKNYDTRGGGGGHQSKFRTLAYVRAVLPR